MKWFYIFSGFLLAPIMGSVAAFIVGVLGGMPLEYAFPFVPIAAVIGYAGEIVIGLPLLAVGYWLSYVRLPLFLAGGVFGALAFWSIYYFNQDPIPFLDFLAMVLAPAVFTSVSLWFVGGWSSNHSLQRTRPLRREA